jgi:hypothetical protein
MQIAALASPTHSIGYQLTTFSPKAADFSRFCAKAGNADNTVKVFTF